MSNHTTKSFKNPTHQDTKSWRSYDSIQKKYFIDKIHPPIFHNDISGERVSEVIIQNRDPSSCWAENRDILLWSWKPGFNLNPMSHFLWLSFVITRLLTTMLNHYGSLSYQKTVYWTGKMAAPVNSWNKSGVLTELKTINRGGKWQPVCFQPGQLGGSRAEGLQITLSRLAAGKHLDICYTKIALQIGPPFTNTYVRTLPLFGATIIHMKESFSFFPPFWM